MNTEKQLQIEFPSKVIMSAEDYHAHPAIGSSTVTRFLGSKSPAHFKYDIDNPGPPTKTLDFGNALHCAALEPVRFRESFIQMPEFSGTGSRLAKERWHLEHHGKIIVTEDDLGRITGMLTSISRHPIASKILAGGRAEESYFWIDPTTGMKCKTRPDYLREGHIVVDLKTTRDASANGFGREIAKFRYHCKSAYYLDGVSEVLGERFDVFVFLAVEHFAPYAVYCHRLDSDSLEEGRREYKRALIEMKSCQETGLWPAYPEELIETSIPPWAWSLAQ